MNIDWMPYLPEFKTIAVAIGVALILWLIARLATRTHPERAASWDAVGLQVAALDAAMPLGDVEVEQASEYLYERGIVAYPYTTEIPVEVLGAKYRWARAAGLL